MHAISATLVALLSVAAASRAQQAPLPAPVADYRIRAELIPATRSIEGTAAIRWRNSTDAPAAHLQLHLYLNAFRGPDSTFVREADPTFRPKWRDGDWGGIDVHDVVDATGAPLPSHAVQTDDDNVADLTVLQIDLPEPVPAGGEISISLGFSSRLPKALRRSGWVPGGGFYCMHWYPVLGVWQQDASGGGRWNCHQFHANSEFFADFATYRVELTMPSDLFVGATGGEPEQTVQTGDGRTTRTYSLDAAHRVHDFAFVAAPDFAVVEDRFGPLRAADDSTGMCQRVAALLGVPVQSFDLPATRIVLLLHRAHDTAAIRRRHLDALKVGLEFYGLRFGSYPYDTITAVDPGADVAGNDLGGGMEYPTLITLGTPLFPHRDQLQPEGVTVHEFGHQYWYGLAANNEFEESWLDEGLDTYSQGRAQLLGFRREPKLRSGQPMTQRQVAEFGMLTVAAVRGPFADAAGLQLRRDLPGLWRLPGFDVLRRQHFDGTWMPDSPLLELLRCQPQVAWFQDVDTERCWQDRNRFLLAATPDPLVMPGWQYRDHASYRANSYVRPATVLRELERLVEAREPGRWWAFLREFHQQSRFRHPTTEDFAALLQARCGAAIADYFRDVITAGAALDYGLAGPPQQQDGVTVVRVRRFGLLTADVQVRFTFEHGSGPEYRTIARSDLAAVHRFEFRDQPQQPSRGRLIEVWVDPPELDAAFEEPAWPCGTHLLDENLDNNAWRYQPNRLPARQRGLRALLQAQCELSFGGWIG